MEINQTVPPYDEPEPELANDFIDLEGGEFAGVKMNMRPEDFGYQYIKDLGSGAFGSVKLYTTPEPNAMKLAIKFINKPLDDNEKKFLEHELNALMVLSNRESGCKHDIVCYYDFMVDRKHYYVIMEYIPWPTLQKIIDLSISLAIESQVTILHNICKALAYVHYFGFAHRDIKPDNIMVDLNIKTEAAGRFNISHYDIHASPETLAIKLVDFGFACIDTNKNIADKCDGVAGTAHYMAPEVLLNKVQAGHFRETDVYSFGILMYYFLTSKLVFKARTRQELIKLIIGHKSPNVDYKEPSIADLIDECIKFGPYERPKMKKVCVQLDIIKQELDARYNASL